VKRSTFPAIVVGLIASLACGCKKNIDNNEAVKQGINAYLSKRSDLLAMDVNVTSVAYRGDEATAVVRFQAKGNNAPSAGMSMEYVLERKGSQWVVKGRGGSEAHGSPQAGSPQGGAAVPGGGAPGAPAGGSIGAMPQTLPPGHPSTGAPGGALPPGHPPIGDKKSSDGK
jgi:hypothetical protein